MKTKLIMFVIFLMAREGRVERMLKLLKEAADASPIIEEKIFVTKIHELFKEE